MAQGFIARLGGSVRGSVVLRVAGESECAWAAARGVLAEHCGGAGLETCAAAIAERVASGVWTRADGEVLEALRACGVDTVAYLGAMAEYLGAMRRVRLAL